MKYLKLFESFEYIDEICKKYNIENYKINPDESIDVDVNGCVNEYVNLSYKNLTKLPLKFNKVNGSFYCDNNKLTTLEGCPKEVNGYFSCIYNELTSFEFAPKIIRGEFICWNNNIKSFEYFPYVKNGFYCEGNPIWEVWILFGNKDKIELLNDFDIFRDEDTDTPSI